MREFLDFLFGDMASHVSHKKPKISVPSTPPRRGTVNFVAYTREDDAIGKTLQFAAKLHEDRFEGFEAAVQHHAGSTRGNSHNTRRFF